MLFVVAVGVLVGLAALVAMFGLVLIPAVLLARFLAGAKTEPETVPAEPEPRTIRVVGWAAPGTAASRPML